MTVQLVRSSH